MQQIIDAVQHYPDGHFGEIVPGLNLFRTSAPYGMDAMVYEPLVCLILQGEKETSAGSRTVRVPAGHTVLVSHAMPVMARVTVASEEHPYLALVARLDVGLLRALDHEVADAVPRVPDASSLVVQPIDEALLDVLRRYVGLLNDPVDERVLAPSIRRELHYRLLRSAGGEMLRALLVRSSHASSIAQAIQTLRADFRQTIEMEGLARSVGMSASSFYKHFKSITSTTPLQYQKDLRLTEARRLLLRGEHTVSSAGFAVGYESASQFSREYARKFGDSPRSTRVRNRPAAGV